MYGYYLQWTNDIYLAYQKWQAKLHSDTDTRMDVDVEHFLQNTDLLSDLKLTQIIFVVLIEYSEWCSVNYGLCLVEMHILLWKSIYITETTFWKFKDMCQLEGTLGHGSRTTLNGVDKELERRKNHSSSDGSYHFCSIHHVKCF